MSGKGAMFKRDIVRQLYANLLLPAFLAVVLGVLFATEFPGKWALVVITGASLVVCLLNLYNLIDTKAIVTRNSQISVQHLVEKNLDKLVREALKRFEKGNSGLGQLQSVAEYCAILLAHDVCTIEALEKMLTKAFQTYVEITYDPVYGHIPALDDTDLRTGLLELKVKDHVTAKVKIW